MMLTDEVAILRTEHERLQAENTELRALVARLEEQLGAALARIVELEQRHDDPPPFAKANRSPAGAPKPPRKPRAAHHNRARQREEPTRIVQHALERCPDCHYRLRGTSIDYTRQVIELPPPPTIEIIEHRVIKRWCPYCHRWRSPHLNLRGQVLGRGRLGTRLVSLIAYLRTSLRLPIGHIQRYLQTLHRVTLSAGAICGVLHQARRATRAAVDALQQQARASPVLHSDATGWRENGQNGFVWSLSTAGPQAVRYYEYDQSRSQLVVKRLLGGCLQGVLSSDFYGAYNPYAGPHQRCWVHLLRALHALKVAQAQDPAVVHWAQAVRTVYDTAQRWLQAPAPPAAARQAQSASLVTRVHVLGLQYAQVTGHPCQALCKRLLRHEAELFQFVVVAGLSADNNLAERSVRPLAVIRKISGGSRSAAGTKTRMALASLFETWQARGLNTFDECLRLLRQTPLPQT